MGRTASGKIPLAKAFSCGSQILYILAILAVGCKSSDSSPPPTNAAPESEIYSVTVTAATSSALPKCTSALAGTTAYVRSPPGLWSCQGSSWISIPCTKVLAGAVAYASATQTLWACVSGSWTQVQLPTGPQGPAGKNGTSCSVADNGNGTKTITCQDGTSATVSNGATGATGARGATGATGADGASCTVTTRTDNAKLIVCGSTSAVVSDGVPGATGPQGATGAGRNSLVSLTSEPAGINCANGGVKVATGVDLNDDGVLDASEVNPSEIQYVCNGGNVPGAGGDAGTNGDDGQSCGSPLTTCSLLCVDLQNDSSNCGACGNACSTGRICTQGQCGCSPDHIECDGACVDLRTDMVNCGSCGTACPTGAVCSYGNCVKCASNEAVCGGVCVDLGRDNANCGSCGNACTAGQRCDPQQRTCKVCIQMSSAIEVSAGGGQYEALALGDLNGDGHLDLVTVDSGSTVRVLMGLGNGSFANPVAYATTSQSGSSWSLAVGDMNSDGSADVVVGNSFGMYVLLNQGDGSLTAPLASAGGGIVAIGDLNGDQLPDVVSASGGSVAVALNAGAGAFASPVLYGMDGSAYSVALGDLNGDGTLDMVSADGSNVGVRLGLGDGSFSSRVSFSASAFSVAIGDLNGDGKVDVVTVSFQSEYAYVLLGQGDGNLAAPVAYRLGTGAESVVLADVNRDGNLDVIAAANASVVVLLGLGDGRLADVIEYPAPCGNSVAVGDLNGDSWPDLVTTGFWGAPHAFGVVLNASSSLCVAPGP